MRQRAHLDVKHGKLHARLASFMRDWRASHVSGGSLPKTPPTNVGGSLMNGGIVNHPNVSNTGQGGVRVN